MARIHLPAVMGFYDDPHDLLSVTEKARSEMGFKNLDAYTPYPVHGIEEALGLRRSVVSTVARAGLLAGATLGFLLQSWTSAVDWPVNIGGKPFVSWPAWVPVSFEAGVLMAGFANLITLCLLCGLYPRPKTVVLSRRITNDRFVLVIPVKDVAEEQRAIEFLRNHKALKVKVIEDIDRKNSQVIFRAAPLSGEVTT